MEDKAQFSTGNLRYLLRLVEDLANSYLGGTYDYNENSLELTVTWVGPASDTSLEPVEHKKVLATIRDYSIANYLLHVQPKFIAELLSIVIMQRNALQDKFMMMEVYARNLLIAQEKAEKFEQYVNAINVAEWEAKTGKEFPYKLAAIDKENNARKDYYGELREEVGVSRPNPNHIWDETDGCR